MANSLKQYISTAMNSVLFMAVLMYCYLMFA